jgi:hypothetical protein
MASTRKLLAAALLLSLTPLPIPNAMPTPHFIPLPLGRPDPHLQIRALGAGRPLTPGEAQLALSAPLMTARTAPASTC